MERRPIPWFEAEPALLERERTAMANRAPDMSCLDNGAAPSGGWEGLAPEWPFDRDKPRGLKKLTKDERLTVRVEYPQGFPAKPPFLVPLDPEPQPEERFREEFHLNGDGTLCLIRHPSDWSVRYPAVDLVEKASGWFIEYLAIHAGLIEEMSSAGMFVDESLDPILDEL